MRPTVSPRRSKGKIYITNPIYGSGVDAIVVFFANVPGMDYYEKLYKQGKIGGQKATDLDGVRNDIPSALPEILRLKGPSIYHTYRRMKEAEERYSVGINAKELGIKE